MRTENECQFSTEKKLEREGKKRLLFCCCGLEQERLGAEIDRLMAGRPPDAPLDWQLLGRFAYLKACLKETFRLNPISIGVGRILPQDSAIAGFSIPKGVMKTNNSYSNSSNNNNTQRQ